MAVHNFVSTLFPRVVLLTRKPYNLCILKEATLRNLESCLWKTLAFHCFYKFDERRWSYLAVGLPLCLENERKGKSLINLIFSFFQTLTKVKHMLKQKIYI